MAVTNSHLPTTNTRIQITICQPRRSDKITNLKTGKHVVIDYFSATFPLYSNTIEFELKLIEDIIINICEFLKLNRNDCIESDYSRNRFKYEYILGDYIILRFLGPRLQSGYPSCQIELKGEACKEYERLCPERNWSELLEYFTFNLRATPTRLDIAIDDYDGDVVTFDMIKQKLESKMFTSTIKSKVVTIHGSIENGYTLELGKYGLSRMLCIYQKDKEQLSKKQNIIQPYWLRFEMRYFHKVALDICLDLLELTDEELKLKSFSLLYLLLDIKKDTDCQISNLYRIETEKWWKTFLEDTTKAKLEKNNTKPKYLDNYLIWIKKNTSLYFLMIYIMSYKEEYDFTTKNLEIVLKSLENIDDKKIKKLNRYLKEYHFPKMEYKDLVLVKEELKEKLKKRELPF